MLARSAPLLPLGIRHDRTARAPSHPWSAYSVSGGTMDRAAPKETRTFAQAEDTKDLEAVISAALSASPVDITALRRGVWTYVGEERHVGTSPGWVILELTKLIESSIPSPSIE